MYLLFKRITLKKIVNITLSLVLAFSILLGYTGVTVYKMVCEADQGKVIVSVVDIADECDHTTSHQDDCCLPISKKQKPNKKAVDCCEHSYSLQKIHDTPVTQKEKNSTEHHLNVWQNLVAIFYLPFVLNNNATNIVNHSPPPKHQSTSYFLSKIQVYLI